MTAGRQWSSRFAFMMAAVGSAVGLGNLWRFPFQTGQNGGAAFVIVYILCVIFIAYPVLMAELSVGRSQKRSAVGSTAGLAVASGASPAWGAAGWFGFLASTLVLPIYALIAGQIMAYSAMSFMGVFANGAPETLPLYDGGAAHSMLWYSLFLGLTIAIVLAGLKDGIERVVSLVMPLFFVMLVGLAVYALSSGAADRAIAYLFSPRFDELTPAIVLAALGQALFSLGVGAGIMITYGAYLPADSRIGANAAQIAAADTLVAILAGLMIFPIVFAHDLDPAAGMGLIFNALPPVFTAMPFGSLIGGLFFFLAFIAAITSSISMLLITSTVIAEQFRISERAATLGAGLAAWAAGFAVVFMGGLGDWLDFTVGSILLPLGALGAALIAGWVAPRALMREELRNTPDGLYRFWRFMIRYAAPVAIAVILVLGVDAKFDFGLTRMLSGG